MTESVRLEVDAGVATLTLNRPDRLNSIDIPTLEALIATLDDVATRDDARCLVLAGAGRAFCAGADQGEMIPRTAAEWESIVDRYLDPVRQIAGMDKPVIARLHGDAVGGGLGLALACDFRIAVHGTRLSAPFVKIALAGCDMSAGYFLPRLIGLGRATETCTWACERALHLCGAQGYMLESPAQRYYRDCKVLEFGEGTSEIMHETIARGLEV